MPGGGNLVRSGRYKKSPRTPKSTHSRYYYTRSLVLDSPRNTYTPARCHSAPRIMDSHSRSASPRDAARPQHRPPSPPATPKTFDNRGYQHDEADQNHNDSFSSNPPQQNGHSKEPNGDTKTLEAVNLELINLTPKNGHTKKKDVEVDMSATNPYDEYFVPVNEHRKYMRGEKLYVTADKRGEKGGCKRPLCWTLVALVVAAIVALIALAATGVLFGSTEIPLEQYNTTVSSARSFGGIGTAIVDHDHSHHDHDDHVTNKHPVDHENPMDMPHDYTERDDDPAITLSEENADLIMYVPHIVEGMIKIDNEEFTPGMKDSESEEYREFSSNFANALKRALFNRSTLENSDNEIVVEVVKLRKGSVLVSYRIHWKPRTSSEHLDELLTPASLKSTLDTYLEQNSRMISIYHVAEDKMTTRNVLDLCQINKNDCEYGCAFDESTLDFTCTCPRGQILDIENPKKCMPIFDNIDAQTKLGEHAGRKHTNITSPQPIDPTRPVPEETATQTVHITTHSNVFDWKEISHVTEETTTESDPELKFSHIFGRAEETTTEIVQKQAAAVPEPTAEPQPSPEPEPTAEPEPTSEPEPSVETYENSNSLNPALPKSRAEPEPTTAPEPTSVQPEPTAESKIEKESTAQPEPVSDIKPEPQPETSAELESKTDVEPFPTSEPEPEPTGEPQPKTEPEPKVEPELISGPESEIHIEPEPTAEPLPNVEPEPTTEYKPDSEGDILARQLQVLYEEHVPDTEKNEPTPEPAPKLIPESISESSSDSSIEPTDQPKTEPVVRSTGSELTSPLQDKTSQSGPELQFGITENEQPEQKKTENSEETNLEIKSSKYLDENSHMPQNVDIVNTMIMKNINEASNKSEHDQDLSKSPIVTFLDNSMEKDTKIWKEENTDVKDWLSNSKADNKNNTIKKDDNYMDILKENMDVETPHDTQERSSIMPQAVTPIVNTVNAKNDDFLFALLNNDEDTKKEEAESNTKSYPIVEHNTFFNDDDVETTTNTLIMKNIPNVKIDQVTERIPSPNTSQAPIVEKATTDANVKAQAETTENTPATETPTESPTESPAEFSIKHQEHNYFKTEDNIISALDVKNATEITITTERDGIDGGTEVTFDEINMLFNRSSKSIGILEKSINKNSNENNESEVAETTTESDWLSVPVTEVYYSELMNKMDKQPTAETTTQKVEDIMNGGFSKDDFEPDYLSNMGTTKAAEQDMPVYGMVQDYDNEEQRVKRVNTENKEMKAKGNSNEETTDEPKVNPTSSSAEVMTDGTISTIQDNLYSNILTNVNSENSETDSTTVPSIDTTTVTENSFNVEMTTNQIKSFINEPAPVWENEESKELTVSGLAKDSESSEGMGSIATIFPKSDVRHDINLTDSMSNSKELKDENQTTQLNNLNVTIYEKRNEQNHSNDSLKPTTAHSAEFNDHEKDPNPFLPEVENNNSLVKKLIEGHDLEPTNMNDTQNENTEEFAVHTNNALNKKQEHKTTTTEDDVIVNDLLSGNSKLEEKVSKINETNNTSQEMTLQHEKGKEKANVPISSFLRDTEDLDVSKTTESENSASSSDSDLSVVPIPNVREIQKKNVKKDSIEDLNDISDSPKKSDRRTLDTKNLESVINNEA